MTRRAAWLSASFILLIALGLGLRGLSTLMSGEDLALVRDVVGDRTGLLTALAHGLSWLGRSYVLVPCAAVLAGVAVARGRRAEGLVMVVGVVGSVILQNVDKAIVGRPRPPVLRLEQVTGTSFPSGHATESTAFFLLLALAVLSSSWPPWLRRSVVLATVGVIAAVALSRVYLGVHYPTDAVAGILLGGSWSLVTAVILLPDARLVGL